MSAHDSWLAKPMRVPVRLACNDCEREQDGTLVSEYGQSWTEPEECGCGTPWTIIDELDELDIAERRLEARGEDF